MYFETVVYESKLLDGCICCNRSPITAGMIHQPLDNLRKRHHGCFVRLPEITLEAAVAEF